MTADTLTPEQAAAEMGVTTNYLAKLRISGAGPEFERLSPRVIRYPRESLAAWRASRRRTSTSDEGAGRAA